LDFLRALGNRWTLKSEWTQTAWRHWNWQRMDTWRRLEFVRANPTTRPAPKVTAAVDAAHAGM
jgi:hypothetical protein